MPIKYIESYKRGEYDTPLEAMKADVFSEGFLERSTRRELVEILRHLYRTNTNRKYSLNACKKRMMKHIVFWFELHNRRN